MSSLNDYITRLWRDREEANTANARLRQQATDDANTINALREIIERLTKERDKAKERAQMWHDRRKASEKVEWQPIGTHPKNEIIIVTDWDVDGQRIAFSAHEQTDFGDWYWAQDGDGGLEWTPTHWMPIPLAAALKGEPK